MNEVIKKDIPGFEGLYYATSDGHVWSNKRKAEEKKLKDYAVNKYRSVSLCKNGIIKKEYVHRIIANTFLKNEKNKTQVNHKNSIKSDNRAENLEWCTPSENCKHSFLSGTGHKPPVMIGEKNPKTFLKSKDIFKIRKLFKKGLKRAAIMNIFKISKSTLYSIIKRKTWSHIR